MPVFDMPEGAFIPHVDAPTQEERFRWGNILSEIIDGMINTGIGKLDTLQEINEFYNRYCVFCVHFGVTPFISLDEAKAYLGLTTNISRETRTKWDLRMRHQFNLA